jgi:hypothetical protein
LTQAFQANAYRWPLRVISSAALLLSATNLLYLATRILSDILTGNELPATPAIVRELALFSFIPGVAVWLIARLTAATLEVEPTRLVLKLRGAWFEIPFTSVAEVRPSRLPLPGPGLILKMKSGRSFRYYLELGDPTPLLGALGQAASLGAEALNHPWVAYARARHARRWRWYQPLLKFGLFPLLPGSIMFRTHQYIAYGGPFGEYQLLGLKSFLKTWASYWLTFATHMLLWAVLWRALAELAAISAAWAAPPRAGAVRRIAEITCRIAYYVGFPALFIARLLM